MMKILKMALVCLALAVFWAEGAIASAERPSPTVEFVETVYFSTVDGSDIALSPGAYDVEVAESWLRVIPQQGTRAEGVLLEAAEFLHQETLDTPKGKVTIEENGIAQLALLLPGGKGLQAMGYRGGILSRAVPLGSAVPQSSKPILTPSPVQTQTSPNAPSPDFKEEITGLKGTNRWLMLEVQRLLTTVAQLQAQVNTLQGRYNNLEGTYSNHQHKYEDSSLPANMLVTIARLRSLMNDKSSNVDHWGFYIFGPPPPKRPVEKFTDKPKN